MKGKKVTTLKLPPDIVELKDERDLLIITDLVNRQTNLAERHAQERKALAERQTHELKTLAQDSFFRATKVTQASGITIKQGDEIKPDLKRKVLEITHTCSEEEE